MPDEEKLAAVRAALPATGAGIYLNTGSAGPLPAETAQAMAELTSVELTLGRGHVDRVDEIMGRMNEARAGVAAVLATDLDSVGLTHATTDGMSMAAWGLDWRPGDRAVTTRHEHPGGIGGLYAVRDRLGIDIAFVEPDAGGDDERTLAAFDAAITPGTRLVAISHVLWTTGAVMPVAAIADLARSRGAVVAVDGAQSVGAIPVRPDELGVDVYAVSAQKWLLGPEGMGALWCGPAAAERVRQTFGGWFSFASFDSEGGAVAHADARRFQGSGFHQPSVLGFARSCGWLSMFVGFEWVHRRGQAQARRAHERLSAIPGVTVLTPDQHMATLVSFRIAGWPAEVALEELGARVFAIARTVPQLDAVRISMGFFTSDDELERFAACVAMLAAHTPETVPAKRRLMIVGES